PEESGDRTHGPVILRRPEPAGADHQTRPGQRLGCRILDRPVVIPDRRAPDDPDPELPEPQPQPRTVAVDRRAQQQLVTYGQQLDGSAHGISHAGRSNGLRPGSVAEDPGAGSVVTGCASSRGTPA